MSVLLETTEGNLVVDLDYEHHHLESLNFLRLCELNHYFFAPFYHVHKNQSVSCGLPNFPEETDNYAASHYVQLDQSEANSSILDVQRSSVSTEPGDIGTVSFIPIEEPGKVAIGSQFAITLGTDSAEETRSKSLIPFAKVVEGFDTLEKINNARVDTENRGRLLHDIRFTHAHVLHDPFRKTFGIQQHRKEPVPSQGQLQNMRFPQLQNPTEEASTVQALSLELIGDLPHYKAKPSPTTLFVARLNPITTEDSLSVIFGRFGTVVRGNIIKNFAFVEMSSEQEVEAAYHALHEGCIIDGNDVVVDFSQSVRGKR